jgi:hypothetical protein
LLVNKKQGNYNVHKTPFNHHMDGWTPREVMSRKGNAGSPAMPPDVGSLSASPKLRASPNLYPPPNGKLTSIYSKPLLFPSFDGSLRLRQ